MEWQWSTAIVFTEAFTGYRFIKNVATPQKRRTCDQWPSPTGVLRASKFAPGEFVVH
jgi:hypothetical protein